MAEVKLTKHTVTNTTDGPKIINGASAAVLQPGESMDVELSDAEHASAKASEWFGFGASAAKAAAKADEDKA